MPETLAAAPWQGANLSFWLIAALVLTSGGFAAFTRNIVQAAYSLFFTLVGMAGLYILLGSPFLAITQVIIYVGGILVLLMFGVLLTNRPLERARRGQGRLYVVGAVVAALALAVVLLRIVFATEWITGSAAVEPVGGTRPIGRLLLTEYLLPFELAGMLLLLGLIGAAYLVRRRET